jgi:hypothetical protein
VNGVRRPALVAVVALLVLGGALLVLTGGGDDERGDRGGTVASYLPADATIVASVAIDPRSPALRGLAEAGAAVPGAAGLLDAAAAFFTQRDVSVTEDVLPLFGPRAIFATASADPASALAVLPVRDRDGVRDLLSVDDDGTGSGAGAFYALEGDVLVIAASADVVAAARARSADDAGLPDERLAARLGPGAGRAALSGGADLTRLIPADFALGGDPWVAGLQRVTGTLSAAGAAPTLDLRLTGTGPPPLAEGTTGGPLVEGAAVSVGIRDAGPTVRFVLDAAASLFGTGLETAASLLRLRSGVDVIADLVDRIEDLTVSVTDEGVFARASVSSPATVAAALEGLAATGGFLGVGVRAVEGDAVEVSAAGRTITLLVRDDELVLGTASREAIVRHGERRRRTDPDARGAVALRVDPEGVASLGDEGGLVGAIAALVAGSEGLSGWIAADGTDVRAVFRAGG